MTQPFEPDVDVDEVTQHHADELRKRLHDEFGTDVDAADIDATMTAALEQLADPADVEDFLPVLAYRYAREKLAARSNADDARLPG